MMLRQGPKGWHLWCHLLERHRALLVSLARPKFFPSKASWHVSCMLASYLFCTVSKSSRLDRHDPQVPSQANLKLAEHDLGFFYPVRLPQCRFSGTCSCACIMQVMRYTANSAT